MNEKLNINNANVNKDNKISKHNNSYQPMYKYQKKYKIYETFQYNKYKELCSCSICNEFRALEICHIVPVSKGGSNEIHNIIFLCPTHHYLYDNGSLNDEEYGKIRDRIDLGIKYHELNYVNNPEEFKQICDKYIKIEATRDAIVVLRNDIKTIQ